MPQLEEGTASAAADAHTRRVQREYGDSTIERFRIFGDAGFINFGFWKNIDVQQCYDRLTFSDRNEASRDLYRNLWKQIDLLSTPTTSVILEAGCGTGAGLELLLDELNPERNRHPVQQQQQHEKPHKRHLLIGQDITPQQLQRAQQRLEMSHPNSKVRLVSSLDQVEPASVDVLYSVEALQCVQDFHEFLQQAAIVLKPDIGTLALTMHLCPHPDHYKRLQELIPTCPSPDVMSPLPNLLHALNRNGFVEVKLQSIGEFVFPGWGAWSKLVYEEGCFVEEVVRAWREEALDYYTVTARKKS